VTIPVSDGIAATAQDPELSRLSNDLAGLGFVHVTDYSWYSESTSFPPRFARLLFHPVWKCWATVEDVRAKEDAPEFVVAMVTAFENGWSVTASNGRADPWLVPLRRPRRLGIWASGAPLTEVFRLHQEQQRLLSEEAGLASTTEGDLDSYVAFVREVNTEFQMAVQKMSILRLIGAPSRAKKMPEIPVVEWWGELTTPGRTD
jgi:hypothetical protein